MRVQAIVAAATLIAIVGHAADAGPPIVNPRHVHFIYLVPQDRMEVGTAAIERAALHLQVWYQRQMANGKTFTLDTPVVTVYHTQHPGQLLRVRLPVEGPPGRRRLDVPGIRRLRRLSRRPA